MKILLLDIETAPNKVYTWQVWDTNISPDKMVESSYVMCVAAKWLGEEDTFFMSVWNDSEVGMLQMIHALLDEADVVVHYNGSKFDIPVLNKEFLKYNMAPPSPYKNLDLYQVVRRTFKFIYNKLDYVTQHLGLEGKVKHRGFQLWIDCMEGIKTAQMEMEEYNIQDILILENLYNRLIPWIQNHPNHSTYSNELCCPKCSSKSFQSRGYTVTRLSRYRRFQCNDCGGWFKSNKPEPRAKLVMTNIPV